MKNYTCVIFIFFRDKRHFQSGNEHAVVTVKVAEICNFSFIPSVILLQNTEEGISEPVSGTYCTVQLQFKHYISLETLQNYSYLQ